MVPPPSSSPSASSSSSSLLTYNLLTDAASQHHSATATLLSNTHLPSPSSLPPQSVTGGQPAGWMAHRVKAMKKTCYTSMHRDRVLHALGWCIAHAATRTAAAESDRVSCFPSSFFSSLLLPPPLPRFVLFTKRCVSPSLSRSLFAPRRLPSSFPLSHSGFLLPPLEPPSGDGCGPAAPDSTACA